MTKRGLTCSLALASLACGDSPGEPAASDRVEQAAPDPLVVATDRGRVRGATNGETDVFRGIPYAAPPVGDLRFRPPQPPAAWHDMRDATSFGPQCPQRGLMGMVVGVEDCLTLNITRPSAPANKPRPVLVFIHGGANAIGSGSDPHHDGRELARTRDVIVVTFNYRLGLLGFFAHPDLMAESGTSGNWAYLDQIAALEWIARNIAAFGGDPERVTIFGQSAGALGVCVLLASPLAAGLFDAAIMQSGGCDVATLAHRHDEGQRRVQIAGCAAASEPIECLRGLSVERLVAMSPALPNDISNWALPFGGAIDGHVLPASPWEIFAAGKHNVVPTLVGSNAHETELFAVAAISDCGSYELAVRHVFGESADEILAEYPCVDYPSGRHAYVAVTTDAVFTCQARRILRSLAAAAAATPLYRYHYAHTRADPAVHKLRAFHGSELQLLFGTTTRLGYEIPEAERALAETMQASWAALAATGSPIHAATPGWQAWDPARDNAVIFASPVSASDQVATSHCEFWDAHQSGKL